MNEWIEFPRLSVQVVDSGTSSFLLGEDEECRAYKLKVFRLPEEQESFNHEREVLRDLGSHPGLLPILDTTVANRKGYILYEHFSDTLTLGETSFNSLSDFLRDLAGTLKHIHDAGYVHRRITLESVVRTESSVKLTNFVSAIKEETLAHLYGIDLSEDAEQFTADGLRPPELIDITPACPLGKPIDMWCLGYMTYQLAFGQSPFQGNLAEEKLTGKFRIPPSMPAMWKTLFGRMLAPDPHDRVTSSELIALLNEPVQLSRDSALFRQVKSFFQKSTKSAVVHATKNRATPPNDMAVRKLIEKAWKKPFKVPLFVKAITQQPLEKPLVRLKALCLVHTYILNGPEVVLTSRIHELTELSVRFSLLQRGKEFKVPKTKQVIRARANEVIWKYAEALHQKIQLHRLTRSTGTWLRVNPFTHEVTLKLLELWKEFLTLLSTVLTEDEQLHELMLNLLLASIQEVQLLASVIAAAIGSLVPTADLTELTQTYQDSHATMTELTALFRKHYPFAFVPQISQSSAGLLSVLKKRRATVPAYFDSKLLDEPSDLSTQDESPRMLQVNYQDIVKQEILGIGSSSTVYQGLLHRRPVAIKVIRTQHKTSHLEFTRELEVLSKKQHPNLVQFIGACTQPELCLLTGYCEGGTLFRALHERTSMKLSWPLRRSIALQIAQGMLHLHSSSPPIIHRDLKSLNVLIESLPVTPDEPMTVKITDFGVARALCADGLMTGNMGTYHWMAPEVLLNQPYTLAADVYSFGIILWEILVREPPYKGMAVRNIPQYVLRTEGRPNLQLIPRECPAFLIELVQSCWQTDPLQRPSFTEIVATLKTALV